MTPTAQRMLDLLADYEKHPSDYHDGSIREPDEEERHEYIEFYRGKAYAYMAEAYAGIDSSTSSGKAECLKYLALYGQTPSGKSVSGRFMIMPLLGKIGEYDKMLAICDEVEQLLGSDTLNAHYASILQSRAIAAKACGRKDEAVGYLERYNKLNTMLNDRLLQSKAHLYAARFRAQEQQREIERSREAERRAIIIGSTIGLVGLLIFLFALYVLWQWQQTKRRNRIIAQQITEAVEYKEKYRELKPTPKPTPETSNLSDLSNAGLFAYLRDIIESEMLFLDPNFERQTLINRTGLSKERIGAAFAQGSDQERLTTLIRELRLEHAVLLMNEQSALTVEQLSQASGFTNASTFSRCFKAKFGMSPTEYQHIKA